MPKECGECKVCCYTTRIPELEKVERVMCSNICERGCSIYDERPEPCVKFQCFWSISDLPPELRPDRCGVIIEKFDNFLFAMCDKDEWKQLHTEFKKYTNKGIPIVVNTLVGNDIILPDGMSPEYVIKSLQEVFNGGT